MLGRKSCKEVLFYCIFGDKNIYLNRVFLAHTMGPGYPLLQDGRIPWEVNIDDSICCLEIEARGTGIRRNKEPAVRILLKLVY